MAQTLLEMAKDLVAAQVTIGAVAPEDMDALLTSTYQQLATMKGHEEPKTQSNVVDTGRPGTDWKKSITKHNVICLECGGSFRQLGPKHLRTHNLDKRSYQRKYGIPRTQSLAAKALTARRRAIVREIRPWEQAAAYRKAQRVAVKRKKKASTRGRG